MIHTSGLLRVTDVIKDLRCGVVTIVTLLVDWRNDYSACSTLTCFRGFLHYDMTRSVHVLLSKKSVKKLAQLRVYWLSENAKDAKKFQRL